MPKPSPCPESHDDTWRPADEAPLLGLKSVLLLAAGALAVLFSLAT